MKSLVIRPQERNSEKSAKESVADDSRCQLAKSCPIRQCIGKQAVTDDPITAALFIGVTEKCKLFRAHTAIERRHVPPLMQGMRSMRGDLWKVARTMMGTILHFPDPGMRNKP